MTMELVPYDQMSVVHEVAADFWHQDTKQVLDALPLIEVVKRTPGRIAGYLPRHGEFPPVFFKVYFYRQGFLNEVEGLRIAGALPPVPNVTAPKLLSVIPERNALVTEKMVWRDSEAELKRFFVSPFRIDWRRVGSWLRRLHDSQTAGPASQRFLHRKFHKANLLLKELGGLFPARRLATIHSVLSAGCEYLRHGSVDWVKSHGDFGLVHVRLSGSTISIIDFEDLQIAPREFDVANLLTRLEYTSYFPHNAASYRRICDDFLGGYGPAFHTNPGLHFLNLLTKLDMLATYRAKRNSSPRGDYRRLVYAHFEREGMRRLCRWLDRGR